MENSTKEREIWNININKKATDDILKNEIRKKEKYKNIKTNKKRRRKRKEN